MSEPNPVNEVVITDSFGTVHTFDQEGVRFHVDGENTRVYSSKCGTIAAFYRAAAAFYTRPPERL